MVRSPEFLPTSFTKSLYTNSAIIWDQTVRTPGSQRHTLKLRIAAKHSSVCSKLQESSGFRHPASPGKSHQKTERHPQNCHESSFLFSSIFQKVFKYLSMPVLSMFHEPHHLLMLTNLQRCKVSFSAPFSSVQAVFNLSEEDAVDGPLAVRLFQVGDQREMPKCIVKRCKDVTKTSPSDVYVFLWWWRRCSFFFDSWGLLGLHSNEFLSIRISWWFLASLGKIQSSSKVKDWLGLPVVISCNAFMCVFLFLFELKLLMLVVHCFWVGVLIQLPGWQVVERIHTSYNTGKFELSAKHQ